MGLVMSDAMPGARVRLGRSWVSGLFGRLLHSGHLDLLVAQAVPLSVSFLLTLVSAAILGPELRGVLTFLMTVALVGGALAYGSLHVPVVEGLRSDDRGNLRYGLRVAATLWTALSIVGLSLIFIGRSLQSAHGLHIVVQLGAGLVGGGLVVVQLFLSRVLQGLARNREYGWVLAGQSLLYLLVAGGLLVVTRSPWLVFWGWYLSVVASLALATYHLRRELHRRGPGGTTVGSWRTFIRSMTANNVGSIGQMIMLRADVLVVALLIGPAATGIYGVAVSLTGLALILPEIFALSVFANRARLDADGWGAYLARVLRLNAVFALLSTAAITAGTLVLTQGPLASYDGLVLLVVIILPGAAFAGYARIALSALQALNQTSQVWRFGVLALGLSVGYVPTAAIGGTVGLAAMSSVAYIATAAFLRKRLRMEPLVSAR
jgi:O-antigen/teichoic acid export membrane protein